MNHELPEGWSSATVDGLSERVRGVSYEGGEASSVSKPGYLPILRANNIEADSLRFDELVWVPAERIAAKQKLRAGDVVVAMSSGSKRVVGKTGQALSDWNGACGAFCAILRPSREIDSRYAGLFFRTQKYRTRISDLAAGTNINNIRADHFAQINVPIAPLAEQRRIVATLEALLSKIDACQQRLAKIPVLLTRFRQSVLAAACSGRLTADWREQNVTNVSDASDFVKQLEAAHESAGGHKRGNAAPPTDEAHDLSAEDLPSTWSLTNMRTAVCPDRPITYGILKPGPDIAGGIPYVRVADFPNDTLNLRTVRRTTKEIERVYARARLRARDILLSIRGTVGRVCVVPDELRDANITQDTARLAIQPTLNAQFVMWFLRAPTTQRRMQKAVKGVAVRGINIGDVRALQLPVPPLAEQAEIVRRVEALFALTDQITAKQANAQAQVDRLAPALLARAFGGELVPTEAELAGQEGRDYEPASVLLERLQRERAANATRSEASISPKKARKARSPRRVASSPRRLAVSR